MEGDTVQSRPWFNLYRIFPTPLRWMGRELLRLLIWLDHGAGRLALQLRKSPAWSFVCLVGTITIGLTVLLFISVIEQTSSPHPSKTARHHTVLLGREHLERNHEWSAEDHWRVAHFFVPHKPIERFKNIKIDSRLFPHDAADARAGTSPYSDGSSLAQTSKGTKEMDVRLEMRRPRKAAQGKRLVAESVIHGATSDGQLPSTRTRYRGPRLLVQAAWEFGSDCTPDDYVSMPVRRPSPSRRIVPEPIPERETPPQPISAGTPDVSLEWSMTRHFQSVGAFPHGSHLVTQSDRSVFLFDDANRRNEQTSFGEQYWRQARGRHEQPAGEQNDYVGLGDYQSVQGMLSASEEFDPDLPSATEINLLVQLQVSDSADDDRVQRSKMIIRNTGRNPVPQIEVQDLVDSPNSVIAARPEATVENVIDTESQATGKLLHREIQGLLPDDSRELDLSWIPVRSGQQFHRSRIFAEATVSHMTEVRAPETSQQMPSIPPEAPPAVETPDETPPEHPQVACDLNYPETAYVGDAIELYLTVRNRGDVELHNVQVRIHLPAQLSHPDGREFVFKAGSLQPNAREQTVVKLSALQSGDAVNGLKVTAGEHIQAKGQATIKVLDRPSTTAPAKPKPTSPTKQWNPT